MITKIEFFRWYEYSESGIVEYQYYIPYFEEDNTCYLGFVRGKTSSGGMLRWNVNTLVDENGEIDYKKMNEGSYLRGTFFSPPKGWEKSACKILFRYIGL